MKIILRTLIGLMALSFFSVNTSAQNGHQLSVSVSVDDLLEGQFDRQGRLFLFISESSRGEPRRQLWPRTNNHIYAQNLDNWQAGRVMSFDGETQLDANTSFSLADFPAGSYRVQVLWDQDSRESGINAAGNLYSEVVDMNINRDYTLKLTLSKVIGPRNSKKHPLLAEHHFHSDSLSSWWGQDMVVQVSVLLPRSFTEKPDKQYPIVYEIGGYGSRHFRASRLVERDSAFMGWWMTEAPEMILVFLDGEGPYGDSYQLDSENSGPYGYVLTQELAPWLEQKYRALGSVESRFVEGCSTGGWVSLALQLYYPDFFGGTFSYSPDPVDFHHMQLVNLYQDENAFVNRFGLERPSDRTTTGDPIFTIRKEVYFENVQGRTGSYTTSGGQWGAWNALYSPRGSDGLPMPIFDPKSGAIDSNVVVHWQKYDLLHYTRSHWPELGPKLQGKLWIWMGDMDNFYLNNALHSYADYLAETTVPRSDAQIIFTPMQGHCSYFNRREVIEMIGKKLSQD